MKVHTLRRIFTYVMFYIYLGKLSWIPFNHRWLENYDTRIQSLRNMQFLRNISRLKPTLARWRHTFLVIPYPEMTMMNQIWDYQMKTLENADAWKNNNLLLGTGKFIIGFQLLQIGQKFSVFVMICLPGGIGTIKYYYSIYIHIPLGFHYRNELKS